MPGCLMAAVRHNRPTIIVYGGTIQPGQRTVDCPALGYKKGDDMTAVDAFESFGTCSIDLSPPVNSPSDQTIFRRIHCGQDLGRRAIRRRTPLVPWPRCMRWYVHVRAHSYIFVFTAIYLAIMNLERTRCPARSKSSECRSLTRLLHLLSIKVRLNS